MITSALILVLLGLSQEPVPPQQGEETKVRVNQAGAPVIHPDPSKRTFASQVSAEAGRLGPVVSEPSMPLEPARAPLPQLANPRDARAPTPQLGPKGATAAPPPALSQLSQGRDTAATALKGTDLCSEAEQARKTEVCARAIETRSAEFPIPNHEPLSPEQRLLANQTPLETTSGDVNSAARRLSSGREDDTLAALAVANLALSGPVIADAKKPEETKAQAPNAIDAVVAAIVRQANGGVPPN
jgi:hypothetical protein